MIFSSEGVRPNPAKVEALDHISPPKSKSELISFVCMMQSNTEFIPEFSKKASKLRELTKINVRFKWLEEHDRCFNKLLEAFKADALLQYFDINKQTYIFTDAHMTGLGAMLAQGDIIGEARPIAFASRTTSDAEKHHKVLDVLSQMEKYQPHLISSNEFNVNIGQFLINNAGISYYDIINQSNFAFFPHKLL